jgi:cell division protein FtsB
MRVSAAKTAFIVAVLLVAAYAVYALRGPNGIPAVLEKREEIRQLEKRNADLAREIEQRRERISRLKESQSEQELEIRRRLKLVKPGEKVFILQDGQPAPQPAAR